jgi:3-oxoadipate enol-lactonase
MQVFVRNGDARIALEVAGDGDAVLLIHGFPLSRVVWSEQMRALSAQHRVVAIDLRGMGASSVTDGPYLMESLAGDIAAVMDHLGIERASIAGHSLGGYVALAFARMYVERLTALALITSRIVADSAEAAAHRRELADDAEASGSNARIIAEYSKFLGKFAEIGRANDPRGLAAMLRGMAMRDSAEDIAGDLNVPVLVVAGAHDLLVSEEEASKAAAAFPHGRLVRIAGAGHVPMGEAPEDLNACLLSWLTGG